MNFIDYTFDGEDDILIADSVSSSAAARDAVYIYINRLRPESLVNMIRGWDDDVISALIEAIKAE